MDDDARITALATTQGQVYLLAQAVAQQARRVEPSRRSDQARSSIRSVPGASREPLAVQS